jgi:class 3 adenylate cyclase
MDQRFEQLLLEFTQAEDPRERERIERALWAEFGRQKAVLVLDMSSFSLLTQKYGIVHYLSMVRRMQLTSRPIIESYAGEVIKFEADNCYAMFDEAWPAAQASIELNRAFRAINANLDDPFDIHISIGVDYGNVLLIGGPDYFGETVNRACKLGEDVAGPGEIILSEAAFLRLPQDAGFQAEALELFLSGIHLKAFNLKY